jgi:hypothetical protein
MTDAVAADVHVFDDVESVRATCEEGHALLRALLYESPPEDWSALANRPIPGQRVVRHGRDADLDRQLDRLHSEFAGSNELAYAHAVLIVAIRRRLHLREALSRFRAMWIDAGELLCRQLNLRWLTSAADTFADHGENGEERSTAMLAATLAGLVKLYETERFASGEPPASEQHISVLRETPVPLLDGLTGFAVGSGDMIVNLVRRLDRVGATGTTPAHRLLQEVVNRVLRGPTVFARLRRLHWREATRWREGTD